MTTVSDHDWAMLNAYADGELSPEVASLFERRIEVEPELLEALGSITQVSSALSTLKPSTETYLPTTAKTMLFPWQWILVGGSIAASIALVGFLRFSSVENIGPSGIHESYLSQSFNIQVISEVRTAAERLVDGFPDLSEANLKLAVTKKVPGIASAHYIGVNGCRLTFLKGNGNAPIISGIYQSAEWTEGADWFLTLSTGMDQQKFNAVSKYLKQITRDQLDQKTILALQGAVDTAAPCAIG